MPHLPLAASILITLPVKDGSKAIGLFNRTAATANIELAWSDATLTGKQTLRDLSLQKNIGTFEGGYSAAVPAHGAVLLRAVRTNAQQ
jgi:alpha-galactosidase